MNKFIVTLCSLIFSCALLVACGQKGALYFPKDSIEELPAKTTDPITGKVTRKK